MTNWDDYQRTKTLVDRVVVTVNHTGKDDGPVFERVILTKLVSQANYSLEGVEAALDEAVNEDRLESNGDSYWLHE